MKFQNQAKTLVAAALVACTALASFSANARIVIGSKTGAQKTQTVLLKVSSNVSPGQTLTFPGGTERTVTSVTVATSNPTPLVIVSPITPSGANKTLSGTF